MPICFDNTVTGEYIKSKWLQHISFNSSFLTISYFKDINALKLDEDMYVSGNRINYM